MQSQYTTAARVISFTQLAHPRRKTRHTRGTQFQARYTSRYHRKRQYYDGWSIARRLPASITANE
ncbi:hypothetical protein E2C01_038472 [Portunus trituberculatus]|uniref:Uncharacterized protein n=1 Tax=Portunus trituberculatus TaxID=210409 RepID=A0A5B7FE90_PORTR|nr:hypothetical protein [Portunus trituberculatus]